MVDDSAAEVRLLNKNEGQSARPNAKDELRARAQRLRWDGWSVPEIAVELEVARSTAFRWTRQIALDPGSERARQRRERSKRMTDARWQSHRQQRDRRRAEVNGDGASVVGTLEPRDLLLLGAAIYWCEGSKVKPWRAADFSLTFTNSDPVLLELFLRFLEAAGVDRSQPTYRVSIHESADPGAARAWWVERLGVPDERFQRATLKRHSPQTNRRNTGQDYHGCLVIRVPRSKELYWQVEGVMQGLAESSGVGWRVG